jgi:gamma-glutamyltranspeptidase/glutathione hydrolase
MVYRTQLRKLTLLVGLLLIPLAGRAFSPVAAKHGMVVASEPLAAEVGLEILRAGGNAVDAAVAVGFALAVTYPQAGNLGGGGFMLIRLAGGEAVVVDYREEAPAAASRDMFLDAQGKLIPRASTEGPLAVGVPGTVAGLALAHQKYGKLPWGRVLRPAIRLAEQGFPVSYGLSQSLREHREEISRFSGTRRIFLRDGRLYEPGEIFRQTDLARTLRQIAVGGSKAFYAGRIARALAATVKKHGGILTREDLLEYQAKIRQPLRGNFRGYEILSVPPPSSGGVGLLEMLNVLEPMDLGPPNSFQSIRWIAETMRRAYADRAAYLGDADFVPVPVRGLISRKYAAELREEILQAKAVAPVLAGKPAEFESAETTHFSVVDAEGNAVANTYTLNGSYGSGVTVEGAGFLLNNQMDDFAAKPGEPNMFGLVQGEANAIGPRKRPLSSMTPTIVLEKGRVRLVLGSPGGGTIINTVLQVLLNVLAFKMDIRQAVTAPRFHHQWMPDQLTLERWGFSADTIHELQAFGYRLDFRDQIGMCEAIEIDPKTGWRFGAADPRGDGKAVGY